MHASLAMPERRPLLDRRRLLVIMMGTFLCCLLPAGYGLLWFYGHNYDPAAIPPEGLAGAEAASARMVTVNALTEYGRDLPYIRLRVFEVRLPDGRPELRAFAEWEDETRRYLGPLARQLGPAPIAWILVEAADTRFILGCLDGSVPGTPAFSYLRGIPSSSSTPEKIGEVDGAGCFFLPIFAHENRQWTAISSAGIDTEESLATLVAPHAQPLDSLSAWEREYSPPVAIDGLFIELPADPPAPPPTE